MTACLSGSASLGYFQVNIGRRSLKGPPVVGESFERARRQNKIGTPSGATSPAHRWNRWPSCACLFSIRNDRRSGGFQARKVSWIAVLVKRVSSFRLRDAPGLEALDSFDQCSRSRNTSMGSVRHTINATLQLRVTIAKVKLTYDNTAGTVPARA